MANLNTDLASLRIPQEDRAGGRGKPVLLVLILIVVALVAGGGWFWSTKLQATPVKIVTVTAKSRGSSASGAVLNASGYVTARRRATVSSKVTGKVMDVLVEEGHPVRQGQVLAHLDDTQTRASLALAEAQLGAARKSAAEDQSRLQQAELTLHRREQLLKEAVVGKAELDEAQSNV